MSSQQTLKTGARRRRKRKKSRVLGWVIAIALTLVIGLGLRLVVVEPFRIVGSSMTPTLQSGDVVIATKLDYAFGGQPQRGDVVLCTFPGTSGTMAKRVRGVPGDTIMFVEDVAYLNDTLLGEAPALAAGVIPDGQYLLTGDNAEISLDGRSYGLVTLNEIRGRVGSFLWPLAHMFRNVE